MGRLEGNGRQIAEPVTMSSRNSYGCALLLSDLATWVYGAVRWLAVEIREALSAWWERRRER